MSLVQRVMLMCGVFVFSFVEYLLLKKIKGLRISITRWTKAQILVVKIMLRLIAIFVVAIYFN